MAKKSTTTETEVKVEEAVAPLKTENAKLETVNIKDAVAEPIKPRTIIANTPTVFRKTISLENEQVVEPMPVGVAYEIIKECKSVIYGDFYQLNNGYYITKSGNYTIN